MLFSTAVAALPQAISTQDTNASLIQAQNINRNVRSSEELPRSASILYLCDHGFFCCNNATPVDASTGKPVVFPFSDTEQLSCEMSFSTFKVSYLISHHRL